MFKSSNIDLYLIYIFWLLSNWTIYIPYGIWMTWKIEKLSFSFNQGSDVGRLMVNNVKNGINEHHSNSSWGNFCLFLTKALEKDEFELFPSAIG